MSEEEKEIIERIKYNDIARPLYCGDITICNIEDLQTVLNLVQKQQTELEKLKNKNKELIRKLRNRVKEVKKLNKYSLYKTEFSKLNKQLEKKDKIIDLMAMYIANLDIDEDICEYQKEKYCEDDIEVTLDICVKCIKRYFERKVENEN